MIHTLNLQHWNQACSLEEQEKAILALESGQILFLPQLSFHLTHEEKYFLTPNCHQGKSKNISFNPQNAQIKNTTLKNNEATQLSYMLSRFITYSRDLLKNVLPHYYTYLIEGRTSFRPIEIEGRKSSKRQDDTRVHVDAFRATPNRGNRILRVFSNINPEKERHWQLGESFSEVLQRFSNKLKKPLPGSHTLLNLLKITRSKRSLYDHYMLLLHDNMKLDDNYQNTLPKQDMFFPPNSSWIVMTDHVSHAALSGQYALEQTFYLPVQAMKFPELSPLRVLESHFNNTLV